MEERGVTILEIILVISLMGVIALFSTSNFSDSLGKEDLGAYSARAVDALQEARSASMHGKGAGKFGVHFEADKFVAFTGVTYSAADPENVEHVLSGFVSATTISILGGGDDVHFASYKGTPTETATVIFSDDHGNTKTITVNSVGMIDVN